MQNFICITTQTHSNGYDSFLSLLCTDGKSNRGNINSAVSAIRATSIQVYAIGIGNINRDELQLIASDPDDEHVFILSNYLDAAGFVDILSVTTCDSK